MGSEEIMCNIFTTDYKMSLHCERVFNLDGSRVQEFECLKKMINKFTELH